MIRLAKKLNNFTKMLVVLLLLMGVLSLQACAVISVAATGVSTAVGVAVDTVDTVVDTVM